MNILVTGSNGRIGRYVVRELQASGHEVLGADISASPIRDGSHIRVDLTDAGDVYQALARASIEAVVHLGAWANHGLAPDTRVYCDNVGGTYNLYQACADLGVKRIISASSNQIYGFQATPPLYVPVDEAHPARPANSYALSKLAGEQAADYFNQRFEMEILSFRYMGVRAPKEIAPQIEAMAEDPASGSWLLWMRTDARDAAVACRLAIEAEQVEPGPYNITGPEVVLPTPTLELVRTHFCAATEIRSPLEGYSSPLNVDKAKRVFGYHPQYSWRLGQYHPESEG